ncbi:MAG: hypothetical protein IT393_07300 [Nitrospirae bacterium]|nr:hypothetical protein [Nitrospirota bacterium]
MKVKLSPATWLEVGNKKHAPDDIVDVDEVTGRGMISGGSATEIVEEVKGDVNTKSRSSSKD